MGVGAPEPKAHLADPDFNPLQEAFYYLSVLENPSCRDHCHEVNLVGSQPTSIRRRMTSHKPQLQCYAELVLG